MEYGTKKSPHRENVIGNPKGVYAKSKFLASKFLIECYKKYKFPVTVIRFYQLFGPNQDTNRFIPILINACLNKKEFATSSGVQSRDFLYVDDAIDAIIKCIQSKNSKGKIFNIGAGVPVKLKKIIDKSKFQFEEIESFYYFPSNRWDFKTNEGMLIKLPKKNILESLQFTDLIKTNVQFKNNKIIDLRISDRIIATNE